MEFMNAMKNPPKEFSPAAFWFWFGELKPERLREQINQMKEQGVHNAFMHARAYLKTPYLGDEWWDAISACIDESEKIDFYPWLYDEYAWPSGTAGSIFDRGYQEPSRTLAKGECNMAKALRSQRYASAEEFSAGKDEIDGEIIALFCGSEENWTYINDIKDATGEILVIYKIVFSLNIDYLNPDTIRDFMDFTHEEYKARFEKYFGNRIPGIFFDEISMAGGLPWTAKLADTFKERCGYDIVPNLWALVTKGGAEAKKIRRDYYGTIAKLYEDSFFKQISDWCKENNLLLTGHIEEFIETHPGRQGQFFNNMRHLSIPGVDCHDYRYRFPRKITYREPKFSVSTSRAYGIQRSMSEALGGAGWGCSLQQFKRGINTICAMGISMITLHAFYTECETAGEQADWPNSFFLENPYWRYFKHFADYINRLCYMNAQGSPVVDVGIYYPVEEMQMLAYGGSPSEENEQLNEAFNAAFANMLENQIDVDMIDSESILRADVSDGRIRVGQQALRVLVCPDIMEPDDALKAKLDEFKAAGGVILYYSWDGKPENGVLKTNEIADALSEYITPDVKVLCGTRDNLFVNHRKIEGKEVYFIANSSPKARRMSLLLREKGGAQRLNPNNGELSDIASIITENGTEIDLFLEADDSCWIILDKEKTASAVRSSNMIEELAVAGKWEFLPISSDIKGVAQLGLDSSVIEVPLALFSSELHPNGRQIRIKNTAAEAGRCGRHLSLWEASWINQHPDWADSSRKENMYFRREFVLDKKPSEAKICIVAVNEFEMWINGKFVAKSDNPRIPVSVDIAEFMTAGKNLIAIHVKNQTPMAGLNLLSVDTLPVEQLTSLLAQAEFVVDGETITLCTDKDWETNDTFCEGWETPEFETQLFDVSSSACLTYTWPQSCAEGKWTRSWERGCPPLLPWGDLPLFGKDLSYPQRICYSVTLPAGTAEIYYPELTGSNVSITIDGMELKFKNGSAAIKVDGNTHQLQIAMMVGSAEEGLHSNIKLKVVPFRSALFDWRLHGLKWYAGFARYKNSITLNKTDDRYILELGQVAFQCEVWVNGVLAGERVWAPYSLDITDLIKDGKNEIVVIAANSTAVERQFMLMDEGQALGWNRYWNDDNIQREGENLVSGLLGPVQLIRKENI
ncbi:MAG: hypothetical protein IJV86_01545 [Clostridia bacterium]|nr:hypothetical protein [Clostridia bacterium]